MGKNPIGQISLTIWPMGNTRFLLLDMLLENIISTMFSSRVIWKRAQRKSRQGVSQQNEEWSNNCEWPVRLSLRCIHLQWTDYRTHTLTQDHTSTACTPRLRSPLSLKIDRVTIYLAGYIVNSKLWNISKLPIYFNAYL